MSKRRYETINDKSAWLGRDLQLSRSWLTQVTPENLREIESALESVKERGLNMEEISRDDFLVPSMAPALEAIADDLENGRGFSLIRGLPVQRWGAADSALVYWGLSLHIGKPVSQNKAGDLIMPIRDAGMSPTDINARAPHTSSKLYYHSDFADIVGLLCMHPAKQGGVSRICSSIAIYNTLVEAGRTDLIDALYDGYFFDRKSEQGPGVSAVSDEPVPMLSWFQNRLSFRYVPGWVDAAVRRTGMSWSALQKEAIDEVNRLSNLPEYNLDMNFQPGDIQYLNNYSVLHSRTAFVDFPEPERKRFLQRIWLRADKGRELADDFDHLFGPASTRDGIPPHSPATAAA